MGRYIDADALIEELHSRYDAACDWLIGRLESDDIEGEIRAMASMGMLIECKLTIEKMPTADVRENVKGKWELDEKKSLETIEKIYICSSCHNNEAWGETERTRYCSYCGAEMENWT